MIWYAFKRRGLEGFRELVTRSLSLAHYAVERFNEVGIPAWRNKNSFTVVFPRPSDEVIRKWQIAPNQDIAHIITMPHITRELIDALVDDVLNG